MKRKKERKTLNGFHSTATAKTTVCIDYKSTLVGVVGADYKELRVKLYTCCISHILNLNE